MIEASLNSVAINGSNLKGSPRASCSRYNNTWREGKGGEGGGTNRLVGVG